MPKYANGPRHIIYVDGLERICTAIECCSNKMLIKKSLKSNSIIKHQSIVGTDQDKSIRKKTYKLHMCLMNHKQIDIRNF